jgi:hypothetical protein
MLYRVEVAGKIFEGRDPRVLLKRAVQARRNKKAGAAPRVVFIHRGDAEEKARPSAATSSH